MNPDLLTDPDHPARAIEDLDVELAALALNQLAAERLEVDLVPSERGHGKVRVPVADNPEFYRVFIHRRERPATKWRDRERYAIRRKPQTRGGRRPMVRQALLRIVNRRPHPQRQWIGWELMEILRDLHEKEVGYASG